MTKEQIYRTIQGKLIVSCQALLEEPLHSPMIMGRMAFAAKQGGAAGIRANTVEDIEAIKAQVDLPVIGIIKKDYPDSRVYITPTMEEVRSLVEAKVEIIALDATEALRPGGQTLEQLFHDIKKEYPNQLFMADCSTLEETIFADQLGFDFVGTTLVGYTPQSSHIKIHEGDFALIKEILSKVQHPVLAEGNIGTPQQARRVLELGCFSVIVGSAITRPQLITKKFAEEIQKLEVI